MEENYLLPGWQLIKPDTRAARLAGGIRFLGPRYCAAGTGLRGVYLTLPVRRPWVTWE